MIHFTYVYGTSRRADYVASIDYDYYEVSINEGIAEIFIATTPDKTNGIIWEDETVNIFFSISAPLQEAELVRLAKNVIQE